MQLYRRMKDTMVRGQIELEADEASVDTVLQYLWAESGPSQYDSTVEACTLANIFVSKELKHSMI